MIEPILDNLLLEPIEEQVNESGIVRPDSAKEKPEIGKILATGPTVSNPYKGKAVYKKWMGSTVRFEGETYVLVAEKDVLGVIK